MSRQSFGSVRRLRSGRWQARYCNGLGERIPAPQTFATKTDARRWLAGVETDLARGTYVDPRAGKMLFATWADAWLTSKPHKRAATLARDSTAIDTHFKPLLGTMALAKITPLHIHAVVNSLRERGLAPKSIQTYMGTLSAIFNAAVESDLLPRTPIRGVHLEPARRRPRPTLTADQLYTLLNELPPRHQALVFVAAVLGLRWSEAIALRVGDIDFRNSTVSVRQTVEEVNGRTRIIDATKSRASQRTMAAPPVVLAVLTEHLRQFRADAGLDELVFIGERGALLIRSFLGRVLKPAAKRAGISIDAGVGLNFHGLRHVATTFMVATGEHPRVMQRRLGHATPLLTLGRYAHVPDETDRGAAERLQALLETEGRPDPSEA